MSTTSSIFTTNSMTPTTNSMTPTTSSMTPTTSSMTPTTQQNLKIEDVGHFYEQFSNMNNCNLRIIYVLFFLLWVILIFILINKKI